MIIKNDVWEIVSILEKNPTLTSKWIYKIKHTGDGNIKKYEEIFVAHGFSHKEDIDYKETFASMVRYTSIRNVLALATVMKWKIH